MTDIPDPVELTRTLLSFNTVNPPGNESELARYVADLLGKAGYGISFRSFAEKRTNVIAVLEGEQQNRPPLCFTGHMDTVPLGNAEWRVDPFSGEQDGDRLYGRGSSDMKGGLAALLVAALRLAEQDRRTADIKLVLTAGEENGCQGAAFLAENASDALGDAGGLVVCEPTANYPMLGHKGALWLEAEARGEAAHGSMPDQGINAIYKIGRAVTRLEAYRFNVEAHPVLGSPTLNVGTVSGGTNVNIVPDRAVIGIDIRTVPGQKVETVREDLAAHLGEEVRVSSAMGADSVWTDPEAPWVAEVYRIMEPLIGETPEVRGVTYFTDASALKAGMGDPPTLILGPGEPSQAHKTDEYAHASKIRTAAEAYFRIATAWAGI